MAEKVRAQEQAEGPLPKKKDEAQETEDEDNLSEEESIEEPVEPLLETDSDRDENEQATNFLIESMGWNVSVFFFVEILFIIMLKRRRIAFLQCCFRFLFLYDMNGNTFLADF